MRNDECEMMNAQDTCVSHSSFRIHHSSLTIQHLSFNHTY